MPKALSRLAALLCLCLLLVYAPELYTAVSAPYTLSVPKRVLLRISLCTQDAAAADAFYAALTIYMKEHPATHIRVVRRSASELFSLPDPQPDLFVFSEAIPFEADRFLANRGSSTVTSRFSGNQGESLLCGVSLHSLYVDSAFDLLAHLCPDDAQ